MPHSTKQEWILLADKAHAKIFTREYTDGAMLRHMSLEHPAAHMSQHDLGTDRPGHSHGSASHHRFGYEDHADFPEQESEAFLAAVAEELNLAVEQNEVGRLVLIALPKTMKILKSGLSQKALAKVTGEYAKNLIGVPEETIRGRIGKLEEKQKGGDGRSGARSL